MLCLNDFSEDQWDAVSAPDGMPVQSWIWAQAARAAYAADCPLQVLAVHEDDALTGVAAFYQAQRGYTAWHRLGGSDLGKCPGIATQTEHAARELATMIRALPGPVDLGHTVSTCPVLGHLTQTRIGKILVSRLLGEGDTPVVVLADLPDDPACALSAARRKSLRRRRRKVEAAHGPFSLRILSPSPATLAEPLSQMFRVEAAGWKGRAGTAIQTDPRQRAFYHDYAQAAAARGLLRLCFLDIGGTPAAAQLAVEAQGTLWSIKTGYDDRFAEASPGLQLDIALLAEARAQGLTRLAYVGKEECWLGAAMIHARPVVAAKLMPVSASGVRAAALEGARMLGKRRMA